MSTRTPAEHDAGRRERLEEQADKHGLTVEEVEAAEATGSSAERFARMKGVRTIDDYRAATGGEEGGEAA